MMYLYSYPYSHPPGIPAAPPRLYVRRQRFRRLRQPLWLVTWRLWCLIARGRQQVARALQDERWRIRRIPRGLPWVGPETCWNLWFLGEPAFLETPIRNMTSRKYQQNDVFSCVFCIPACRCIRDFFAWYSPKMDKKNTTRGICLICFEILVSTLAGYDPWLVSFKRKIVWQNLDQQERLLDSAQFDETKTPKKSEVDLKCLRSRSPMQPHAAPAGTS